LPFPFQNGLGGGGVFETGGQIKGELGKCPLHPRPNPGLGREQKKNVLKERWEAERKDQTTLRKNG